MTGKSSGWLCLLPVPGQCVHDLVIHHLVRVIAVVGKDRDAGAVEILQNRGGAGGAAALPVLALAKDIQPLRPCLTDKRRQRVRLRHIGVVVQPHIRQSCQIQIVNEVFAPTEKAIEKAKKILAAIKEAEKRGSGVIAVNGKMVDRPVVIRAQRTIDLAIASGILTKEEVYE